MSSDSSSSEDDIEKLKEAVDGSLLPQNLYKNGILNEKCEASLKPSLRKQSHKTATSFNPFTVKVTPEFQNHVAKHLARLLDELIYDTEIIPKKKKSKMKQLNFGIKLLHSSKNYVLLADSKEACTKPRDIYKRKLCNINFEERAKEVAVSPEWVLSKQEIKHWAPEVKGEVEIVKFDKSYNKLKHPGKRTFNSKPR